MMPSISENPLICLVFASFHLVIGHFLSSLIYYMRFSKSPIALYNESEPGHMRHTRQSALFALIWVLNLVLFSLSRGYRSTWLGWEFVKLDPSFGWIVGIIGCIGMFFAQLTMGKAFRIGQEAIRNTTQNTLKRDGLFRASRNPVYVFSLIYLLGVSLWILTPICMLGLVMIIYHVHHLILEEERVLRIRFGEEYKKYMDQVSRYFDVAFLYSKRR